MSGEEMYLSIECEQCGAPVTLEHRRIRDHSIFAASSRFGMVSSCWDLQIGDKAIHARNVYTIFQDEVMQNSPEKWHV